MTRIETRTVLRFGGSLAARLRHAIDGGAGKKVASFDPAAVPPGTDEEAAGTPTQARRDQPATTPSQPPRRPPR